MLNNEKDGYEKEGYLNEPFRLFHLTDQNIRSVKFHYHDFDKLIFFRRGKVTYYIEGKSYELSPGDVVVVGRYQIHRLKVDLSEAYERYVLYVSHEYLETFRREDFDPFLNFHKAAKEKEYVLRYPGFMESEAGENLLRLEKALLEGSDGKASAQMEKMSYGRSILPEIRLLDLLISLGNMNEEHLKEKDAANHQMADYNEKVIDILDYIKSHLTEEISIDGLAERFFISKFYMMRLFKKETGFTIHKYILEKRIMLAKKYLLNGMTPTRACESCGFQDYSTFIRAFQHSVHMTPKDFAERFRDRKWDGAHNHR